MVEEEDEDLKRLRLKKMRQLKHRIQDSRDKSFKGVMELNSKNFFNAINEADFSIVDLHADWCAPCKMMDPIYKKLANSPKYNKILFCSLDADRNPQILQQFGVMGIPTFLIFSRGKLVRKVVGAVGEASLRNVLNRLLQKYK